MSVSNIDDYYGRKAFNPIIDLTWDMRNKMKGVKYDTIVGTGVSGTVFASRVAASMRKKLVIVRKNTESSHDGHTVIGDVGKRWLFVDDFISRGTTIRRVQDSMDEFYDDYRWRFEDDRGFPVRPEFVGVYEYDYARFTPFNKFRDSDVNERVLIDRKYERRTPAVPVSAKIDFKAITFNDILKDMQTVMIDE